MKFNPTRLVLIVLLGLVIGISYFMNRQPEPQNTQPKLPGEIPAEQNEEVEKKEITKIEAVKVTLTINGYDEATKEIIPRINLWNNYETRERIVGQVRHGQKVVLIKRVGDGVMIETTSGMKGWLTYWFIKEYQ